MVVALPAGVGRLERSESMRSCGIAPKRVLAPDAWHGILGLNLSAPIGHPRATGST